MTSLLGTEEWIYRLVLDATHIPSMWAPRPARDRFMLCLHRNINPLISVILFNN